MKNIFKGFKKFIEKLLKNMFHLKKKRSMKNYVWRFLKVSKKIVGKYS